MVSHHLGVPLNVGPNATKRALSPRLRRMAIEPRREPAARPSSRPPVRPGAVAHLFEVVHLDQAATLRRHLHHAALQVEHLGAIRAAGDDLAVELVLDARVGFQRAHGRDVLHEAELAGRRCRWLAQRGHCAPAHAPSSLPGRIRRNSTLRLSPASRSPLVPSAAARARQVVRVHRSSQPKLGKSSRLSSQICCLQPGIVHMGEQAGLVGAEDADGEHAAQGGEKAFVFQLAPAVPRFGVGCQRRRQREWQRGPGTLR